MFSFWFILALIFDSEWCCSPCVLQKHKSDPIHFYLKGLYKYIIYKFKVQ